MGDTFVLPVTEVVRVDHPCREGSMTSLAWFSIFIILREEMEFAIVLAHHVCLEAPFHTRRKVKATGRYSPFGRIEFITVKFITPHFFIMRLYITRQIIDCRYWLRHSKARTHHSACHGEPKRQASFCLFCCSCCQHIPSLCSLAVLI